ncbi:alpha-glucan-branching enzyme, partial [Cystoisospora suis]
AWVRNARSLRIRASRTLSECIIVDADGNEEEPLPMQKRAEFLFEKAFVVHRRILEKKKGSGKEEGVLASYSPG